MVLCAEINQATYFSQTYAASNKCGRVRGGNTELRLILAFDVVSLRKASLHTNDVWPRS